MGIAGGRVAWVRRVLGIADQGVVIRIGEQGVAWVAPCHSDWFPGRRVGGAVSLGLVRRASCGWHRVIRIGEQGVVWVVACVAWVAPCH